MYSGPLTPFCPDESGFQYAKEREDYVRLLQQETSRNTAPEPSPRTAPKNLAELLEQITPEDSAIVGLLLFLLCDGKSDPVLIGILLYLLLASNDTP